MYKRILTLFPIAFIFFGCVSSEKLQLKLFTNDIMADWEGYRTHQQSVWSPLNYDLKDGWVNLHKNFGSFHVGGGWLGIDMLLKNDVPIDLMKSGGLWCDVSTTGNHINFEEVYLKFRKYKGENWLSAFFDGQNERNIFYREDVTGLELNCALTQNGFNSYQLNLHK